MLQAVDIPVNFMLPGPLAKFLRILFWYKLNNVCHVLMKLQNRFQSGGHHCKIQGVVKLIRMSCNLYILSHELPRIKSTATTVFIVRKNQLLYIVRLYEPGRSLMLISGYFPLDLRPVS